MPSLSKIPRVRRKHDVNECYTDSTYRHKSFPKLMEDFDKRCAYSLLHVDVTSEPNMEIDHHNPKRGSRRHVYGNLYPAFSLCNGAKLAVWPSKNDLKKRRRYLDCCKESDYNVHFFENRKTGELLPVTPEGVYHIENCDLNNAFLKNKRRERTEDQMILAALKKGSASPLGPGPTQSLEVVKITEGRLYKGIPEIDELPADAVPL